MDVCCVCGTRSPNVEGEHVSNYWTEVVVRGSYGNTSPVFFEKTKVLFCKGCWLEVGGAVRKRVEES